LDLGRRRGSQSRKSFDDREERRGGRGCAKLLQHGASTHAARWPLNGDDAELSQIAERQPHHIGVDPGRPCCREVADHLIHRRIAVAELKDRKSNRVHRI
jgi:hypothetical protein